MHFTKHTEVKYMLDKRKVRIARVEKDWSVSRLANESGINRKTISEIEKGIKERVRSSTVELLAYSLGKDIRDLCSQVENTPK